MPDYCVQIRHLNIEGENLRYTSQEVKEVSPNIIHYVHHHLGISHLSQSGAYATEESFFKGLDCC